MDAKCGVECVQHLMQLQCGVRDVQQRSKCTRRNATAVTEEDCIVIHIVAQYATSENALDDEEEL